jgi:hypothetical protein
MKELKKRWGITSNFQLVNYIYRFCYYWLYLCLDFETSLYGIFKEDFGGWFILIRLLIIFPLYQVLLVCIGALFGQFQFFWGFEKRC